MHTLSLLPFKDDYKYNVENKHITQLYIPDIDNNRR